MQRSALVNKWKRPASANRFRNAFVFLLLVIPCSTASLSAQDDSDALRKQVQSLQKENARLKAVVQQGTQQALFEDSALFPVEELGNESAVEVDEDEQRIRRIIDRYLRDRETPARNDAVMDERFTSLSAEIQKLKTRLDHAASTGWAADGLTFVSANGDFKTHMGGTAQMDAIAFPYNGGLGVPGGAGTQNSVEFRRMRFRGEGTIYQNIDWVSEFDFALALQNVDPTAAAAQNLGLNRTGALTPPNVFGPGGSAGPGTQAGNTMNVIQTSTVFIAIKDIPVLGTMRVGNQVDWLSLEHIVSARFQDFMERSPIMDAFSGANNNGYVPGISFFNVTEDKLMTWQFGAYNNNVYNSGYSFNVGNQWMYGGRVTWSPYYDEDSKGRYVVHTGLGVQYRQFNTFTTDATGQDNIRIRSRGVLRNVASTLDPNFADTGNFYVTGQTILNPEIAIVWDRWFLQAEVSQNFFYGARSNKGAAGANDFGTVSMSGGYVEALYFLTGEHKEYNRNTGSFGRVIPNDPFNIKKETAGGWQIGGRFDWLDLNAKGISGGLENDWTLGVNWFLNANARIQFNYVFSLVSNQGHYAQGPMGSLVGSRFSGEGELQSVGTRLDFNF